MNDPMNPTPAELAIYRAEVSQQCATRFGCTWADLNGDDEPLFRALSNRESAPDFAERYGEKYDLVRVDQDPPRTPPPPPAVRRR
jgi:hypothetical protein